MGDFNLNQIQITEEISKAIQSLQQTISEKMNFKRMITLNFNHNQLSTLEDYQQVIQTIGTTAENYQNLLIADARESEAIVEQIREYDQRIAGHLLAATF